MPDRMSEEGGKAKEESKDPQLDIFISHTDDDREIALALAEHLEEAGYRTWYYERDSIPGVPHMEQTTEAIEQSGAFLIIVSKISMGSDQVNMEFVKAFEESVPILAVF